MKFYALVAMAAVVFVGTGVSAYESASTSVSGQAGASAIIDSGISAQVKNVVQTLINIKGTTSVTGDADVEAKADADTSVSDDSDLKGSGDVSVVIISRADVEGGNTEAVQIAPAGVRSQADLSGYVAAQIVADDKISQVKTSADDVSVTYEQRAYLLGFMPVTVEATATVHADGTVAVRYPWYAFLMATNKADLEVALTAVASNRASAASASTGLSSRTQAELISEIRSVLKTELAADLAAEASAQGGVEAE